MTRKLMPWRREQRQPAPVNAGERGILDLHREIDRLFADFFAGFGEDALWPRGLMASRSAFPAMPKVDVAETADELVVKADLPGMEEKDLKVTLDGDLLTIRGTRSEEKEDKRRDYHLMERSYGEFHRTIQLPAGVDRDKVKAAFKNGVLQVTLPKRPEARAETRHIEIAAG